MTRKRLRLVVWMGFAILCVQVAGAQNGRRHQHVRDPRVLRQIREADRLEAMQAAAASAAQPIREAESRQQCPPGMAFVPGGRLDLNQDDLDASGREIYEADRHQTVAAFCIDFTEVTVAAYRSCSTCSAPGSDRTCNWNVQGRDQHPINCVNASQAMRFCASVGARLPTEWEWQFAGRGPDGRTFPWGNNPANGQACWSGVAVRRSTCAVRSFIGGNSPFGIFDLAGNVSEWATTTNERYGLTTRGGGSWDGGLVAGERTDDPLRIGWMTPVPGSEISASTGFRCARRPYGGIVELSGVDNTGGAGTVDAQSVSRIVRSQTDGIRACYERELRANTTLSGRMEISFTIGSNGRVSSIATAGPLSSVAPSIGSCVNGRIRSLVFPTPEGGSAEFSFPLAFRPEH